MRGGLSGWARGEVLPVRWPTVAAGSADCLSEHRAGSRVFLSLVQCSRGARTRTHQRQRGSKRDSASARLRCSIIAHEAVANLHQNSAE